MRFGGFLMIWGGCLGTGIWYCCRYLRGIRTMMHLEVLLLLMEERMRYGRNSMTVVLQELCDKSQGDVKKFWQSMIEPDLSGELSGKSESEPAVVITGAVPQQTACRPFGTAEIKT